MAHTTKSRDHHDQSCQVIQVCAWGWSKAVGAVGISVMYHTKTQLCVLPAIPTVNLGALLSFSGKLFGTKLSVWLLQGLESVRMRSMRSERRAGALLHGL